MKHIFKKIAATISAAAMCAAPMANALSANAAASANARYTFRQVYWADGSANVKRFEFSFAVRKYHDSVPFYNLIGNQATIAGGGSAGDSYYSCGGTVTAKTRLSGPFLSVSAYSENPADYADSFGTCRAYKANGRQSYNSIYYSNNCNPDYLDCAAFLVGDLNGDLIIDGYDYSILEYAVNQFGISSYGYNSVLSIWGNTVKKYQMDIDNDGDVDTSDVALHLKYISNQITRFDK
ncbi:hypothetical protein [Ruminococcus sp.]|uniref:hypothetical protein n=1 Tax=Ruminococcus sp. TaxID=41978 RepID=UPI002BBDD0D3|nr:hypothetical protein [Ruminococcus sp.]HNZ98797.1 hypothetical protein [Ruminococcus sp.]HOH88060.1 hypothetical protein [Ruminococcus sp.]